MKDRRKKKSEKNVLRNPLDNLLEDLLNTWPVITVFIGLILGTKNIKDRRTPTCFGSSYSDTTDSGAFGTHWTPTATHLLAGGLQKQEMRDCKGIKILLATCPSSHRGEDFYPNQGSSGTELCDLFAKFIFTVLVSSMLGFLSLPLRWVFFTFSFHHGIIRWVGLLLCLGSTSWGLSQGCFSQVKSKKQHHRCRGSI